MPGAEKELRTTQNCLAQGSYIRCLFRSLMSLSTTYAVKLGQVAEVSGSRRNVQSMLRSIAYFQVFILAMDSPTNCRRESVHILTYRTVLREVRPTEQDCWMLLYRTRTGLRRTRGGPTDAIPRAAPGSNTLGLTRSYSIVYLSSANCESLKPIIIEN